MEPEDACGVGVSHPALARPCSGRAGLGLEALYREKHSASSLPKVGGKKPSPNNLLWSCFLLSTSEEGRTACQAEPRGARPRVPEVLLLSLCLQTLSLPASTQSREGNFCDFQLCTGPRCPGTTVVIESRWPFAANKCKTLHRKPVQFSSVDN